MANAYPLQVVGGKGYEQNGFIVDQRTSDLLKKIGPIDGHIHAGPDAIGRYATGPEIAIELNSRGYKAVAYKNHESSTANLATISEQISGMRVIGAVVLNRGLDAVRIMDSYNEGARIVWMPSTNAANEPAGQPGYTDSKGRPLPAWAKHRQAVNTELIKLDIPVPEPTYVLSERGNPQSSLIKPAMDCLEVIAAKEMAIATSHLGTDEGFRLLIAAKDLGIRMRIVTHPDFPTTHYDIEQQVQLARDGNMIEQCAMTPVTRKCSWDDFLAVATKFREEGMLDKIMWSSDFGAKAGGFRAEDGMEMLAQVFLNNGFTQNEIAMMASKNAANLYGIKIEA